MRRKDQGVIGISLDEEEDLVDKVNKEIEVSHPICYDTYDLCERYHSNTLQKLNVVLLRAICSHFEIPVNLRDKKQILIEKLSDMISDCQYVSQ